MACYKNTPAVIRFSAVSTGATKHRANSSTELQTKAVYCANTVIHVKVQVWNLAPPSSFLPV